MLVSSQRCRGTYYIIIVVTLNPNYARLAIGRRGSIPGDCLDLPPLWCWKKNRDISRRSCGRSGDSASKDQDDASPAIRKVQSVPHRLEQIRPSYKLLQRDFTIDRSWCCVWPLQGDILFDSLNYCYWWLYFQCRPMWNLGHHQMRSHGQDR